MHAVTTISARLQPSYELNGGLAESGAAVQRLKTIALSRAICSESERGEGADNQPIWGYRNPHSHAPAPLRPSHRRIVKYDSGRVTGG